MPPYKSSLAPYVPPSTTTDVGFGADSSPNLQNLTPGHGLLVWDHEFLSVASPPSPPEEMNSLQVAIRRELNFPACLAAEVIFTGDPGSFQIDLQVADTDADQFYVTKASLSSGLNSSFCGRLEVLNIVAKYARLHLVALANAVAVTAKLS